MVISEVPNSFASSTIDASPLARSLSAMVDRRALESIEKDYVRFSQKSTSIM
jgi:hypothetical protein